MKALVEPGRNAQGPATSVAAESVFLQVTHGLSHETRNALNALAIHLEVLGDKLRDQVGGIIPPHLEKNIRASRAQVSKLSETLARFSEFVAMRQEPVCLRAAFENAQKLCSLQLRRADVSFHFDIPERIYLDVDPPLLQRILVEAFLATAQALPPCRLRVVAYVKDGEVHLFAREERDGSRRDPSAPALQVMQGEEAGARPAPLEAPRPLPMGARLLGALDALRDQIEEVGGELRHRGERGGCELRLPLARHGERGGG